MSDHYPDAYEEGYVEFFYQKFFVNGDVLIPRYETEQLVRHCITLVRRHDIGTLVDIGIGSGIIPISIANNTQLRHIFATDVSESALNVARKNAQKLGQGSIQFFQGDLLEPFVKNSEILSGMTSLVMTANLPYVGTWEKDAMSPDTVHEPDIALFGDSPDGFDLYRRFFAQLAGIRDQLPPTYCVIEFGMWQRDLAEKEFRKHSWKHRFFEDERGIERFAEIDLT